MRPLHITLFTVALLLLLAQSLRHVYVKWFEPQGSALDRYRENVETKIAASQDLSQLLTLYEDAHRKVQQYEKEHPQDKRSTWERQQQEPYKSEQALRDAIQEWERRSREIRELMFFWIFGALFVVTGVLVYLRVSSWLGTALVTLGFIEMIWWASPSFRTFGAQPEFERLLTLKLILSMLSTALLVIGWLFYERRRKRPLYA